MRRYYKMKKSSLTIYNVFYCFIYHISIHKRQYKVMEHKMITTRHFLTYKFTDYDDK